MRSRRAASEEVTTPPSSVMNSRRFIRPPIPHSGRCRRLLSALEFAIGVIPKLADPDSSCVNSSGTSIAKKYSGPMRYGHSAQAPTLAKMSQALRSLVLRANFAIGIFLVLGGFRPDRGFMCRTHLPQRVAIEPQKPLAARADLNSNNQATLYPVRHEHVVVNVDGVRGAPAFTRPAVKAGIIGQLPRLCFGYEIINDFHDLLSLMGRRFPVPRKVDDQCPGEDQIDFMVPLKPAFTG